HGLRSQLQVRYLEELAGKEDVVGICPGVLDEVHDFFVQLEAVGVGNASPQELLGRVSGRRSERQSTLAEIVERHQILQQLDRCVQAAEENVRYEPHASGHRARVAEQHQRTRRPAIRLEMMFRDMDAVIAKLLDQRAELPELPERL